MSPRRSDPVEGRTRLMDQQFTISRLGRAATCQEDTEAVECVVAHVKPSSASSSSGRSRSIRLGIDCRYRRMICT